MFTALIVLIIIVCILLVLVVLIQNPKGGISNQFSGAASQIMGVKKTNDLLENVTWGLAIALLVFALLTNALIPKNEESSVSSSVVDKAKEMPVQTAPPTSPSNLPPPSNLPAPEKKK